MPFKFEGKEMYPIFVFANFWTIHSKAVSLSKNAQTKKKTFPHKLCGFISSLSACPASSASIAEITNLLEAKLRATSYVLIMQ